MRSQEKAFYIYLSILWVLLVYNAIMQTTDPQEELIIEVDENNSIKGPITRHNAHTIQGTYYRTIYILIRNSNGEILLQKRSSTKDLYPNCWDLSVGGHVNFESSYIDAAIRELKEEMNLLATPEDMIFKGEVLVKLPFSGEFFNVFEYHLKNNDIIKVSEDEVSSIKWLSIDLIKESMQKKSLLWYGRPLQVINTLY